ncbi:MAG: hypothetical protein AVDCRST_MAG59-644, partial [uncultured Thermomicrobiales bacterium]
MDHFRSDHHGGPCVGRCLTRRAALRAGAGLAATMVAVTEVARAAAANQDQTPAASPAAGGLPDLRGVTPLPLTGGRLAEFEAYAAAKL